MINPAQTSSITEQIIYLTQALKDQKNQTSLRLEMDLKYVNEMNKLLNLVDEFRTTSKHILHPTNLNAIETVLKDYTESYSTRLRQLEDPALLLFFWWATS